MVILKFIFLKLYYYYSCYYNYNFFMHVVFILQSPPSFILLLIYLVNKQIVGDKIPVNTGLRNRILLYMLQSFANFNFVNYI